MHTAASHTHVCVCGGGVCGKGAAKAPASPTATTCGAAPATQMVWRPERRKRQAWLTFGGGKCRSWPPVLLLRAAGHCRGAGQHQARWWQHTTDEGGRSGGQSTGPCAAARQGVGLWGARRGTGVASARRRHGRVPPRPARASWAGGAAGRLTAPRREGNGPQPRATVAQADRQPLSRRCDCRRGIWRSNGQQRISLDPGPHRRHKIFHQRRAVIRNDDRHRFRGRMSYRRSLCSWS